MTKKYYNVELPYNTKEKMDRVDNFRMWLYDNDIKHEISGAGDYIHFEVLLSDNEVNKANKALDDIVWYDAITEK